MLYTGYFRNLRSLQKIQPDAAFNFLEDEYEGTTTSAYQFLRGLCFVFAHELATKIGYEIEMITDWKNSLIHTYCTCQLENGQTAYIDVRGATTDEKMFFSEFEDMGIRIVAGKLDEEQFSEGYLRTTKYLTAESLRAMNPSLFANCDSYVADAQAFLNVQYTDFQNLFSMQQALEEEVLMA